MGANKNLPHLTECNSKCSDIFDKKNLAGCNGVNIQPRVCNYLSKMDQTTFTMFTMKLASKWERTTYTTANIEENGPYNRTYYLGGREDDPSS